jgi:hypothetical protein
VICRAVSGKAIWGLIIFWKRNMPRGGTTGLPPTPAELRARAARARHHAGYLSGDEAEKPTA